MSSPATSRALEFDLINRAQQGDSDAFSYLFHTHRPRVFSVCLRMTNNAAEAEDLTQETFMRVFQKLATFRRDCALSSWLYRIAVNTVLMHFRKETVPQVHLDDPISQDAQIVDRAYGITDPGLSHCVERIALERAIAELPRGYRLIFLLHDLEGYAHEEIAQLLLCSPGTSKSQLHRARLRIRQLLRQRMRGMLKPGSRRSRSRADDLPRRAMTLAAGGRLRPRGR